MATTKSVKTRKPFLSYIVQLFLNLSDNVTSNAEVTFAEVEPHGAVTLVRFVSGCESERFELSAVEFDALVATARRRQSLMKRNRGTALSGGGSPLDDYPF